MPKVHCKHCHQLVVGFGVAADGTILCHTQERSCYMLVTQRGHKTDGSCCTSPFDRESDG